MNRDIKRWEFMEYQDSTKDEQLDRMRRKYKLGQKGNGSASYNPINMEYEATPQGERMQQQEQMRSQRAVHRGANIEQSGHPMYNPINGIARSQIQANAESVLQKHSMSIPIPSSRDDLGSAG